MVGSANHRPRYRACLFEILKILKSKRLSSSFSSSTATPMELPVESRELFAHTAVLWDMLQGRCSQDWGLLASPPWGGLGFGTSSYVELLYLNVQ